MPIRVVIWILGIALAATAAFALLALVMPSGDVALKLTGTSGLLAAACLAILPTIRPWESSRASPLSRIASLAIAFGLAIGLLAIWWETLFGPTGFDTDRLWVTELLLGGWLLLAWLPLRLLGRPGWRWPASITLAMVSGAFLLFVAEILGLWSGDEGRRGFVLLGFAPVLGTLALPFPVGHRSVWRWGRLVGLASTLAAIGTLLVMLPLTWQDGPLSDSTVTLVIGLTSVAVTVAVGVALEFANGPPWKVWVHRVTIVMVGLEGALVTMSVERDVGPDVVVPLGLVAVVGLVTAVLLDAIGRIADRKRRAVATITDVRLSCPRCGKSQVIAIGRVERCGRCGLGIELRVRQDECLQCGYSRFGLPPGTACPECGTPGAEGVGSEARIA